MKLTGKEDGHTIGAYLVRDELTNLIFPGSQSSQETSLHQNNTSAVFRYKKDFGSKYTVGLIATDREAADYFNRLAGLDGNLRLTNSDRLQLQLLGSSTKYPEAMANEFSQKSEKFSDHLVLWSMPTRPATGSGD